MTTQDELTRHAAETYFTAWQEGDFDAMAALFTDDVDFVGAMGRAHGRDECLGGLRGVRGMVAGFDVIRRWVDGADAITWFELRRDNAESVPTVNWSHVTAGGRIDRIRVTFDPRPLLG